MNNTVDVSPNTISVFVKEAQYQKILYANAPFLLLFELSSSNRKFLLKVFQDCLKNEHFLGMVFIVNKNEILFDRLFFLRNMVLKLLKQNKQTGIWGIPYCVKQLIFGSYNFSHIARNLTPGNGVSYSKYVPAAQYKSSLMLKCSTCIAYDKCDGLGSLQDNQSMWRYRTSSTYRQIGRDKLFKTDNEAMQDIYKSFSEYIDHSDLTYADRYLYFIKNIDFGSSYSFTDRFVYHCDYLPLNEYEKELQFLDRHIQNKSFLPIIEHLAKQGEIGRIAYSKAEKNNIVRESFYVAPVDERSDFLLHYFNIKIDVGCTYKLHGVGVDYYNGQIKSYKVYLMLSSKFLLKMHPEYLKKIDIDLVKLSVKEHYYIIRLDADKQKISERIDFAYNKKDHLLFQPYLKYLPFSDPMLNEIHIIAFAFEFEDNNIEKINIYYRNRF